MARNEEKNYSELNRLYLASESEKRQEKRPERPRLSDLHSASEVKQWIPSIKGELNYCIQQLSGVRNYPEYKIREFEERVQELKREYNRFVRRCLELDPDTVGVPGEGHAYISRKKRAAMRRAPLGSHDDDGVGEDGLYDLDDHGGEGTDNGTSSTDAAATNDGEDLQSLNGPQGTSSLVGPLRDGEEPPPASHRKRPRPISPTQTAVLIRDLPSLPSPPAASACSEEYDANAPENQPLQFKPRGPPPKPYGVSLRLWRSNEDQDQTPPPPSLAAPLAAPTTFLTPPSQPSPAAPVATSLALGLVSAYASDSDSDPEARD